MKRIRRSAIVPHSAESVYGLVENVEAYPRFLPWCLGAEVERGADGARARLDVGMRGMRESFTTFNRSVPGRSIDMRLVEGPFRRFAAGWRFEPLAEQACRIEFSMEYEFASRALGRLLEPLFAGIADTLVDAFTRRADEVAKG